MWILMACSRKGANGELPRRIALKDLQSGLVFVGVLPPTLHLRAYVLSLPETVLPVCCGGHGVVLTLTEGDTALLHQPAKREQCVQLLRGEGVRLSLDLECGGCGDLIATLQSPVVTVQ